MCTDHDNKYLSSFHLWISTFTSLHWPLTIDHWQLASPFMYWKYWEGWNEVEDRSIADGVQPSPFIIVSPYWVLSWINVPNFQTKANSAPFCDSIARTCLMTIADNEFQSQPCLAICYTHDETLEQSRCYEMHARIQTHIILVLRVGEPKPQLSPLPWLNLQHLVNIADSESQSQPCLVFCYPCSEIL